MSLLVTAGKYLAILGAACLISKLSAQESTVRNIAATRAIYRSEALSKPLSRSERLAESISTARQIGFLEQGTEISKAALLECQKGDYPGGGTGLFSIPSARANVQSDHCRRF